MEKVLEQPALGMGDSPSLGVFKGGSDMVLRDRI